MRSPMFDVKYDRDGNVVSSAPVAEQPQQPDVVAEPEEQVVEQSDQEVEAQVEQNVEKIIEQAKPQEKNFAALRQAKERAERERDDMLRQIQELKMKQAQQPEEDLEIRLGDDDLAEGKHLSKMGRKVKLLEQQLQQAQQQTQQNATEIRLRSQFKDFDSVVSVDNIAKLREDHPEIAQTIAANPDLYTQAVTAYKLIKRLNISEPEEQFNAEKELVKKNAAKPRPLSSVSPQQGDTPLSRANAFANGLTDELKEQLRKEMYAARRQM